ncbi:hypothetical protein A2V49_04080 [candidate division WWE3 bacterium RBG_19FT_COMBO_34_6]|uniref:Vitamin K epoxide reductase domain-containing protein n=1 Tax=candidate division WWE3 bacterium RBG_19FT_COMBO_34_6 TaxID=1802612 RepID=A0A1F4UMB3_UNCKA|nr:MAG: hypothetical protein A2V49_04080 [candidate division WWE3 bacterium RBG_19FT_COMBO_34_6]
MRKYLLYIQSIILLSGTIFAWVTVYKDFARFYNLYGTVTKISGCVIPNPVTTPCFYGAFAFLTAFIISLFILKKPDNFLLQKRLIILLIAGTIFAWSNFGYEVYKFYLASNVDKISCSGVPTENVFATPCFVGACIFLSGLLASIFTKKCARS